MRLKLAMCVLVRPGIMYNVAALKITMNAILVLLNFLTGLSCGNLILPNRYSTIRIPIITHIPRNTSLFKKPHCFTRSALERNLTAMASSRKPSTTLTLVSQPPDFGNDCNQPGNMANNPNGRARANPKPARPTVNGQRPPPAVPTSNEPSIGPVQENETIASVRAIKKIPPILVIPDLESILL